MEFRKISENGYEIEINQEWHYLCCCANCLTVSAAPIKIDLSIVDEKIGCCSTPENWTYSSSKFGNTDGIHSFSTLNKQIKEFMEKYE